MSARGKPPSRQVALLRGINVGKAKRVAMADLRALLEKLGYSDVRTLLNSGNVVFSGTDGGRGDAAARIEMAIAKQLGVTSRVIVLSAAELAMTVGENPIVALASDHSRLLVAVLGNPADRARLLPLSKQDWGLEALALGKRVAYMWCPGGWLESPLATAVTRLLGEATTVRNWTTMTKLHALAAAGSV